MNTDVLFDRAFAIRAAKPWQHLFDTHIFAVRFSDGEIACCSVMGRNGTHLADGIGRSKKAAEQNAAKKALEKLKQG